MFFMQINNLVSKINIVNLYGRTLDLVLTDLRCLSVNKEDSPLVAIDLYHPALVIEFNITKQCDSSDKQIASNGYNFSKVDFLHFIMDFEILIGRIYI